MQSFLLRLVPVLALTFALASVAAAQSPQATLTSGSDTPDGPASPVIITDAPQVQYMAGDVLITHSVSQEIVPEGVGVMCPTPPTSVIRVFDLAQFGLEQDFMVTSVDIGIREVGPNAGGPTDVRLYTLDGDLELANMTLVAAEILEVSPDDFTVIRNVPIEATFALDQTIVLEWHQPVENVFFGGNTQGQTGPTYLWSPPCGAEEPTDLVDLADGAFADHAWVANLRGQVVISTEPGAETAQLTLGSVYPNPAATNAVIPFTLQESGHVRLAVYDALGREVVLLADQPYGAGPQEVSFSTAALASGLYYVRIVHENEAIARRMVVVR